MTNPTPLADLGTPVGHREIIARMKARAAQQQTAASESEPEPQPEPEARHRARIIAYREQTTGQFFAMPQEDRGAFKRHCQAIIDEVNPQTSRERWSATAIAEDMWRLDRARAIENNIYCHGISGPMGEASIANSPEVHAALCYARIWLQDMRGLQALAIYEQRVRRNLERNEKQLRALQKERKAEYKQALENALILFQLAAAESRVYDPEEDVVPGQTIFTFTADELTRHTQRELRLAKGRRLRRNSLRSAHAA
jgi:hypothetical protein